MSRTDVHAPAWVKERDPLWRAHYVEDHNHAQYVIGHEKRNTEDGHTYYASIWKMVERCDLDEYLAARGWARTACHIRMINAGRNVGCGCRMCTGQTWRKFGNRTERYTTKKLLRADRWDEVGGSRRQWSRY